MTNFGPLGETVFNRTYSRLKPDGSQESWEDTVDRVVAGNIAMVDPAHVRIDEAHKLKELMLDFKIIPAGRHLWATKDPASGEETEHLFNCHRSIWGPRLSSHFCYTFNALLCGGGVGDNYSTSYLSSLPTPSALVEPAVRISPSHPNEFEVAHRRCPLPASVEFFEVEDSREGWVEALRFLIDKSEIGGGAICFDVSKVRPRGAAIKKFGGTASGPAPLVDLLFDVAEILNGSIGRSLTPLEAMQIDHLIAVTVVSGNVRRSARFACVHHSDPFVKAFLNCKKEDPTAHFTTNISVEVDDKFWIALANGEQQATEVWDHVLDGALKNGEPGLYNTSVVSASEKGDLRSCNPCGEVPLPAAGVCNLGHVNLERYGQDLEGATEAVELMTRFLVRATHAKIEDQTQREVNERDRRIGCGLLGVTEWALAHGIKWSEIHKSKELGAKLGVLKDFARQAADDYADELQIARPIKCTTLAPTGTIAKLPGVQEGCHPLFARYFIRRIRFADHSPELKVHEEKGHLIEDDIYTPNTKVVSIPCKDPLVDLYDEDMLEQSNEIPIDVMLATQLFFQQHYTDQAVSFTANVNPDLDKAELDKALRRYGPYLKGTTIFPDLSRPMSPYERITKEQYEQSQGGETAQGFDECATGSCSVR